MKPTAAEFLDGLRESPSSVEEGDETDALLARPTPGGGGGKRSAIGATIENMIEPILPPFEKVLDETDPPKIKRRSVSREPKLVEPSREEKAATVEAVLRASAWEKKRKAYWDYVD
jgi:hypothetical protein